MSKAYWGIASVLDEVAQPWMNESGDDPCCDVIRRMAKDARKTRHWQEYTGQEPDGIYWVAGMRPETDCDVDSYGHPIGWYTGEQTPFVALVEIGDGYPSALPVYGIGIHEFEADWPITHVMEFQVPEHPAKEVQP